MQTITKGGRVFCRSSIHYPADVVKSMKKAGYKVKETEEKARKDNEK